MDQEFDYQKLIPKHWPNIRIRTEDDLIGLGRENLEHIKQYWEREQKKLTQRIIATGRQHCTIKNMEVADLETLAHEQYKAPVFRDVRIGYANKPEPFDEDSLNRESGTTTFVVCGWCKHCLGGTTKYCCHITTTCGLLPRLFHDGDNRVINDELSFDTPCLIVLHRSRELLKACLMHTKSRLKEVVAEKSMVDNFIDYTLLAISKSTKKPHFAGYRPRDHFNVGDQVVCFVSEDYNGRKTVQHNIFVSGTITEKNGGNDSSVMVRTDSVVYLDEYPNIISYKASAPEIIKNQEFEYLKANPSYLKIWMTGSAFPPKFNIDIF